MGDVLFTAATPYVPAQPAFGVGASAPANKPVPAAVHTPASTTANLDNISNKFKVKTELTSAHTFTYTFFDAKTLEVVSRWPVVPAYRAPEARVSIGAASEAIA